MDQAAHPSPFQDRRVLLGVAGSIAAFKAVSILSVLVQEGAGVDVILTEAAAKLVTPLTFQAITAGSVLTDMFAPQPDAHIPHVTLAERADVLLIAPATAHTMAKLSLGLADNLLSATALSTSAPLLLAPAMESGMWLHPATQEHVARLRERGATFVGPESGHLASGASGVGRMAEPDVVLGALRLLLGRNGPLAGKRIVVTAGGTREPLDPVRFLGNHSSGRMGFALAQAALDQGAAVTLIAGPVSLPRPYGLRDYVSVTTAAQMAEATLAAIAGADALLMAAAVADFRPANTAEQKIKKEKGAFTSLPLERTSDILALVAREKSPGLKVIGFAAETSDLVANAQDKLRRKALDLIVANPVPATFGAGESEVTLVDRAGKVTPLPRQSKRAVALRILEEVRRLEP
ncbi:MAG: bifunctional phosphopantothenoylcysteine decarboxylase/phosphopantothenate--cysteine ligase CoaBC [Chloroflexi bacterium]|nr:bifunctional phosphopantothenoylcysteine decarboxylase/phosphopantothenate--cysteine ligase CoaBC [Chloroflexota bacterium]